MLPLCDSPGGLVVKNLPAHAGDLSSIPGSGKSPEVGNSSPRWYSCLENSMDRGAWRAAVHEVAKSRTRLSMHMRTELISLIEKETLFMST